MTKETIHTLRNELTLAHQKQIEKIVAANQDKGKYYIFVVSKPHSQLEGVIKTTFILMDDIPPQMLGTMLYAVDNKRGRLQRIWVIPRDIIRPEHTIDYENSNNGIFEMAKKLPLLN